MRAPGPIGFPRICCTGSQFPMGKVQVNGQRRAGWRERALRDVPSHSQSQQPEVGEVQGIRSPSGMATPIFVVSVPASADGAGLQVLSAGLTMRRIRPRQRTRMFSPQSVISDGIFNVSYVRSFSERHVGEEEDSARTEILGEAEPFRRGCNVTQGNRQIKTETLSNAAFNTNRRIRHGRGTSLGNRRGRQLQL